MNVLVHQVSDSGDQLLWNALARLHREEIAGGFLTSLGDPFLQGLYKALAQSPSAVLFVATVDDRPCGFILGTTGTSQVYREGLRRLPWSAICRLAIKLVRFEVMRKAWETLCYPSRTSETQLPAAEILNFCVSSSSQGRGIGRQLFAHLMRELRMRGVDEVRIVTGASQTQAHRFYEKVGATLATTIEVHRDSDSLVYTNLTSNLGKEADMRSQRRVG